ncbi:hypothetical protein [Mycobacterium intracellulare]|uniref:hypothetical protein n=1 Tax=Mycobacterium intracellulare TaxID=1767 RepID=UPI001140E63C|nr:hypothetical protein [Mycobacterium intracellulare]
MDSGKGVLDRVQIRKTRTFDSSPTRQRGHGGWTPKTFADVDLWPRSCDRVAATIERVKADDPRELRRRSGNSTRTDIVADPADPTPPSSVTLAA